MRSFPPDVLIIDREGIRSTRLEASGKSVRADASGFVSFSEPCFDDSPTPMLIDQNVFAAALEIIQRRRRMDGVSILLPDSWFRSRMIEVDALPDNEARQAEAVQWAMRKHSPSRPGESRLAWQLLETKGRKTHLLVLEATEAPLAHLEQVIAAAGLRVVLIEPVAMSVWNGLATSSTTDNSGRVLVVGAHDDITMMHFRGETPTFIRARRFDSQSALRDIRLAASYMRRSSEIEASGTCWVVGDLLSTEIVAAIENELGTRALRPTPDELGIDTAALTTEIDHSDLIAALGVFAA